MYSGTPELAKPDAPRRGRPRLYRDLSQQIEGARMRKRRQRERERDAGMQTTEIRLDRDSLLALTKCALVTFTDPKALAAALVARALPAYQREIEQLQLLAGTLWTKALPYLHHGRLLEAPGSRHRTGDRTLTHAQWRSITAELAAFRATLTQAGWSPSRIDRFMRRSAEHLALTRKHRG